MTAPDPLAGFWVHQVTVTDRTGTGAHGDVYGTPYTLTGFVSAKRVKVRTGDGAEIVASGQLLLPKGTVPPPLGSRLTLPAHAQSADVQVVDVQVHDGGGLPTPDHVAIAYT